jgi:hypothetical protein
MLAVSLYGCRIPLPVLLPVSGIAGAPFSGTVPANFPAFGIGGDFVPVILSATLSLALGSAADCLEALKLRWLENLLAVAATPFTHRVVVAPALLMEGSLFAKRNAGFVTPRRLRLLTDLSQEGSGQLGFPRHIGSPERATIEKPFAVLVSASDLDSERLDLAG